jgi:7,8-dihydro-6-hydroxymethylpterin dimethyltransferase
MSTFSDFADMLKGPEAEWGQLSCGCHPNCGTGMAMMIDKETKEAVPVTAFINTPQLAKDIQKLNDANRRKSFAALGVALALLRNYNPFAAPTHFSIKSLMQKFDKSFGLSKKEYGSVKGERTLADIEQRRSDRFNYDFRRTEQCIIPYATQEGEISFCAYNTGVGWRNIVEKMHMTATLTKWYDDHGRHEIFAGGKNVGLRNKDHSLKLVKEHVDAVAQDDLDKLGIAKTAREEKTRARDEKLKDQAYHNEMAKLYRKHVLKEPEIQGFVSLDSLKGGGILPPPPAAPGAKKESEEGVFGD